MAMRSSGCHHSTSTGGGGGARVAASMGGLQSEWGRERREWSGRRIARLCGLVGKKEDEPRTPNHFTLTAILGFQSRSSSSSSEAACAERGRQRRRERRDGGRRGGDGAVAAADGRCRTRCLAPATFLPRWRGTLRWVASFFYRLVNTRFVTILLSVLCAAFI